MLLSILYLTSYYTGAIVFFANKGIWIREIPMSASQYRECIFFGGTTAPGCLWRPPLIERLVQRGVPREILFDPVVPDWNEEVQRREEEVKTSARRLLFVLANPKEEGRVTQSLYAPTQAVQSALNENVKTLILFDKDFLPPKQQRPIKAIERNLEAIKPGCVVADWDTLVDRTVRLWQQDRRIMACLEGTCGKNFWRDQFLADLKGCGVHDTRRFFDPMVPPGTWNMGVKSLEDQVRGFSDLEIFFIGDPKEAGRTGDQQVPTYSMVEAYTGLGLDKKNGTDRTVVCFDLSSWEPDSHAMKAVVAARGDMMRDFPSAIILKSLPELEEWIVEDWEASQTN